MISQRINATENEEPYDLFSILIGIFFVITANVAMIVDLCDVYKLTRVKNSIIARLLERMKCWIWRRVFSIKISALGIDIDESEECDGWVNYVLTQTKDAIEISEHNILNDIRILVSRLEQKGLIA